ncbi:MAG: ribonuclease D [Hoeflea sp.]|uniref:ribonuclease D n=1 Tax=Hoeflea sp. TaxID=1940281 RepID=UPI001D25AB63|nr:ribonuclease D [Hoeflea sp.]MBU4530063.1 ribonuclease D [Alphaproteobacteria bacterium]MBU4542652.1 ribonuclease D [Alphaproteobacteria bacterium]MBU4551333.1 ribonuclease D [Alphaproteobacteria bacterium]MBV1723156.1 ribonuclease D [Hoeflea sp.]MBV1760167.1 ribonuclease D [Hoeflea sp.]
MITTTEALAAFCTRLASHDYVTVDTEFLRETTYWPELCLIQMAGPEDEGIVDPLAEGLDLKPFYELMADTSVIKVFHAARQDIEIVVNRGDLVPHPIFDTQVAAMVCGFGESISYDQLVSRITGAPIDKSSRFTDWSRRPLSDKQLDYALADVTHLRDVYLELVSRLEAEGRGHWVADEMAVLESRATYEMDPEDAWKRLKMRVKKPVELCVLQQVAAWREREARTRNVPRGRVIKDDAIYEIAQQQPVDAEAMSRLRTIPRGWERSAQGAKLIEIVNKAVETPKDDMPRLPRHRQAPEGAQAAIELLRVLLKLTVEKENVAAKIIATSDDLEAIAIDGEAADVPALKGWRRELFGDRALKLIRGELALRFTGKRVDAVEL